ncbi:hypothetical protein CHCC15381_4737 [Bacillus paralicheniformis]|uniref:Alpha/beta hydrolase n=1 Tax=Bacillus paralicheniformis TaxID=1648923 RepID=A0ABY3FYT8_9BACI|nr:hypothetical protein CHCC15381_4737 [Bacillus paralicheniformis]
MDSIDRDEFYQAKAADVSFTLHEARKNYLAGHFSYESIIPSGDPVNDSLKGEVFLNKNDIDQPNVIFVHGWRMDSYDRIKKIFHDRMMNGTCTTILFRIILKESRNIRFTAVN